MSAEQIKSEIRKTLENIPENVLQDILEYLQEIQKNSPENVRLGKNLKQVITEDKELLEKLAK